ncbi:MAG: response regulator transcription factor [Desulfatitalea sp.]|nr:LytTR family DNA-binding domain-containing protein [Desulfatitalea sp.]NNJ98865.1 response regulator transcription factor [Desulfatitalea sp.]
MSGKANAIVAIIADDEKPSRSHLKSRLLSVWPDLSICAEAKNGIEAKSMIETLNPDIAFLDIKMPGLTGIEVARETAGHCTIVFVTAYDEFAVAAFENEAVDYILKPATVERLEKTVKRIKARLGDEAAPREMSEIFERLMAKMAKDAPSRYLRWIKAQINGSVRFVPVEKILYFKANQGYTSVFTEKSEMLIKKTIAELSDELDPGLFFRIHRGTIVNAKYIDSVSDASAGRHLVRLRGRSEIHRVSRSYAYLMKRM